MRRNNCVYATVDTCYSVWMSVCLSVCLPVDDCLSVCLWMTVCLSVCLWMTVCLSACGWLSVCLPVDDCLSVCLWMTVITHCPISWFYLQYWILVFVCSVANVTVTSTVFLMKGVVCDRDVLFVIKMCAMLGLSRRCRWRNKNIVDALVSYRSSR
jgi:hypothetical protein